VIALLLSLGTAWPCAALLTRDVVGELASSDAQEVILERNSEGVRTRYRVSYDGNAESFGWLIVTRGNVGEGDITEADEYTFEQLRMETAPELVVYGSPGGSDDAGGGCACRRLGKGDLIMSGGGNIDNGAFALEDTGSIDITAEGFAGPFAYTALSATDADALVAWLEDNDFTLGDTASTLQHYIEDGNYTFVAVTLAPDTAETPAAGRTLPALSIQSDAEQMEFPARMSYTGMAEELRTTVYVLGEQTAEVVSGWSSQEVVELRSSSDPEQEYDDFLRDLATQGPTYAAVYSGQMGSHWVTRFDTLAHRSLHTEDPVFDYNGVTGRWSLEIRVDEDYEHSSVWFWLPLFGLGIARRRKA